jgi:hypothetical protein
MHELNRPKYIYPIIDGTVVLPDWIKSNIDSSKFTNLKCPFCDETDGELDVYQQGYDVSLYLKFICNHKMKV